MSATPPSSSGCARAEENKADTDTVVATGKEDALARGVYFLNIEYQATSTKTQTAKIPIAPAKADTAIVGLRNNKYRNKDIVDVRVPRRRVFVV